MKAIEENAIKILHLFNYDKILPNKNYLSLLLLITKSEIEDEIQFGNPEKRLHTEYLTTTLVLLLQFVRKR